MLCLISQIQTTPQSFCCGVHGHLEWTECSDINGNGLKLMVMPYLADGWMTSHTDGHLWAG